MVRKKKTGSKLKESGLTKKYRSELSDTLSVIGKVKSKKPERLGDLYARKDQLEKKVKVSQAVDRIAHKVEKLSKKKVVSKRVLKKQGRLGVRLKMPDHEPSEPKSYFKQELEEAKNSLFFS